MTPWCGNTNRLAGSWDCIEVLTWNAYRVQRYNLFPILLCTTIRLFTLLVLSIKHLHHKSTIKLTKKSFLSQTWVNTQTESLSPPSFRRHHPLQGDKPKKTFRANTIQIIPEFFLYAIIIVSEEACFYSFIGSVFLLFIALWLMQTPDGVMV